jgi:hypothetical protein
VESVYWMNYSDIFGAMNLHFNRELVKWLKISPTQTKYHKIWLTNSSLFVKIYNKTKVRKPILKKWNVEDKNMNIGNRFNEVRPMKEIEKKD